MFGLGKKKAAQIIPAASIEEETGMKEYVSIESVQAHLVDILEENRRLKKEADENRDHSYKRQQEERKKTEVALIEGDEWKKRAKEKDEEIRKLKKEIDAQDVQIEKLKKENNSLITDAEMARESARKTREEYAAKRDCAAWLKDSLDKYCGYEWERVTKTQLVGILKKILKESDGQQDSQNEKE